MLFFKEKVRVNEEGRERKKENGKGEMAKKR
jgi:hypothetical protein